MTESSPEWKLLRKRSIIFENEQVDIVVLEMEGIEEVWPMEVLKLEHPAIYYSLRELFPKVKV